MYLAFYHTVFIILCGRRKAIIDPQTASMFRQNPTFASKKLKLISSKPFQTILQLFTCISAQYHIDYNSLVNEARKCEALEKIKSGIGGI
jgi:hypothetical protein